MIYGDDDPDRVTSAELLDWIEFLPEDSATMRRMGSGWTTVESILARHNNDYRSANWDAEQGQPDPGYFLDPPHTDTEAAETDDTSASVDELRDLVHGRKTMGQLRLVS